MDTLTTSPSQINWLLFVSIYTMISIAYLELAPRFMSKSTSDKSQEGERKELNHWEAH